jgi:phospholipid/cholesterol/gamma-HCH transport system substrate-binding protein
MSPTNIKISVGVFLLLGMAVLATLTVLFSRSSGFYGEHYELRLQTTDVGEIKSGAKVLMRGIPVGSVRGAQLADGGRRVVIFLKIAAEVQLYSDAHFKIEQAGFLGDQFIAIYPAADQGYVLTNHAEVVAREPFNMQEAVAVATDTVKKINEAVTNLNAVVVDVRRFVLTEERLVGLGGALEQMSHAATKAEAAVQGLNWLIESNSPPVSDAISNLHRFTTQLPPLAGQITAVVTTNEAEIRAVVRNFHAASASLTNLMAGMESGQGPAGRLLRDEEMARNLAELARNLSITSSNLNTRGLWGIMWKQKPPKPDATKK